MSHDPGPTETRFEELKRYVRFSAEDARRLASLRGAAEPQFPRIAAEFYERIREHQDAHAVFTGEAQVERLQRSLVVWLERLLSGRYDDQYFEKTLQIGRVHVRVGLPQRYMFTAMAIIRSSLMAIAEEAARNNPTEDARSALSRILDLDLAIMVEGYRDDMVARIERMAELDRDALSKRALRAERRYVDAVELADAMMVGLAHDGTVVLFNKTAEEVTGFARDEALGRDLGELVLPEQVDFFRRAPIGTSEPVVLPLRTRAGKVLDMRWRVVRLPEEEDAHRDVALFGMGYDVTDERARRQRDQRQERLAAVGTLAAGLAHEIRNPLNGAQLHMSLLERLLNKSWGPSELPGRKDALEAVGIVRDELKRLGRLVTDFLDFARPRPLAIAETSLRLLCERAMQLVSAQATSAVVLRLDLPATDIVLEADKERLEQVLLNLLHNAVEAIGLRGGNVVLRVRRRPRHASIEVEDDGPGLPVPHAPIFDAFFSTKSNGTGLGLAIAHRVVSDHNGTIDLESRPGLTCFRVVLPLSAQSTDGQGTRSDRE